MTILQRAPSCAVYLVIMSSFVACTTGTETPPSEYVVAGQIQGLAGSGLTLAAAGQTLVIPAGATSFRFPSTFANAASYDVTVANHPTSPTQTCSLINGSGVIRSADATGIVVSCKSEISSLTVTSPSEFVALGGTLQLAYSMLDTVGGAITSSEPTWTCSDPAVLTVDHGLVTGVAPGTATITATAGSQAATISLRVVAPFKAQIAFTSSRDGQGIFVMSEGGTMPTKLIASQTSYCDETRLSTCLFPVFDPAISPSGTMIAFTLLGHYPDIEYRQTAVKVCAADMTSCRVAGNRLDGLPPFHFQVGLPVWSPDSAVLAEQSNFGASVSISTAKARFLDFTPWLEGVKDPSWSPDSKRVVFSTDERGAWDLFVMNADGSRVMALTEGSGDNLGARWSPAGDRIVFQSNRTGDWEVFTMHPDGTNVVNLTQSPGRDQAPCWSPDGRRIAFETDRDGNSEIYVMNADGSNPVNLTNHPAEDTHPTWSP